MQELNCPYCHKPLSATEVNISSSIGACTGCNKSFKLSPTKSERTIPHEVKNLTMERRGGESIIRYRWFTPVALFLIFFAVVWDGFLIFWYATYFLTKGAVGISFALFPLIHVAVGVWVTYTALCKIFNKTIFKVSTSELKVSHAPFPWLGMGTYKRSEIDQVYIKEKINRSNRGSTFFYPVFVQLKNGKHKKILPQNHDYEVALKLEYELERALMITDRPVPGEFRP